MARKKIGFDAGTLIMLIFFAVIGLYIFSLFTTQGAEGFEFSIPESAQFITVIITLLIVAVAVIGGYALVKKIQGGAMSKRDAFTLVLIGIAVWWLWNNILAGLFDANSLSNISFSVGKKIGLI